MYMSAQDLPVTLQRGCAWCEKKNYKKKGLRGAKGVPRKGVWTSVDMRVWTCNELKVKHDQIRCYLRHPFLRTPLVPSRQKGCGRGHCRALCPCVWYLCLWKKTLLRIRRQVGELAWKTSNQGLETSFCCCFAGPRLELKECFCSQTPVFTAFDLLHYARRCAAQGGTYLLQIPTADPFQTISLRHTCHILPPSEIDLGLCLAVFAGSGGKRLFHRTGRNGNHDLLQTHSRPSYFVLLPAQATRSAKQGTANRVLLYYDVWYHGRLRSGQVQVDHMQHICF